ncbi:DnaJ domain-containing protein [Nodosilinea sp. P-1105]|uniref:DnaJ domain-containing protein n=1 Tax=Nodosilinea sp. P-1105 TaxID=2546229 RepID=UPI00146D750C|nr:DnaJ domain-containing protein [Nodosilinea sp. P-1105]NMF85935.1 J domain-containing protein [Nodosilinea sp. P-1105]
MSNPTPFSSATDYYTVLGVDPQASQAAIKRAYRQLARRYHPDLNPDDATAAEQFKYLNRAYQVLSDPQTRQQYDRDGHPSPTAQSRDRPSQDDFDAIEFGRHGSFEDLLGDLFRRYQ